MDSLFIASTEDTPEISFDLDNSVFTISGRSLPENAIEFFQTILEWINEYANNPSKNTTVEFMLEYFNTASAKQIAKVLKVLESIARNNDVLIKWHYNKIDTDMLSSGKRYAQLIQLDFEFIEIS